MPGRKLTSEEVRWLFANLRRINFFASIGLDRIDEIISRFIAYDVPSGRKIIREGAPGDALYIIKSGEAGVFRKSGWFFGRKRIAILREGDFAGEISLVSDEPTTASIRTTKPSTLLVLLRKDFLKIKSENKLLSDEIDYIIEKRKFDNAFNK